MLLWWEPRHQLKNPFNKIPSIENNDSISAEENSVKVDGLIELKTNKTKGFFWRPSSIKHSIRTLNLRVLYYHANIGGNIITKSRPTRFEYEWQEFKNKTKHKD